jgi:hypothetical protein
VLSGYHLYAARTGSFIVRDATGHALAYVYFEEGHPPQQVNRFVPGRHAVM